MLKPWKETEEECYLNVVSDEDEELLCVSREKQDVDDATYGIQLSPKQTSEMKELIQKYHDIVGKELKKTRVAEHKIPTSSRPIRQRPYHLPPAIKDDIIKELNELKDSGIIEESNSDWASPIVVVQKKDGSNRICVDYRKLNSTTKFDAYPMPRIDEMLDAVGKSNYLTTLDLTKGYWQVPMSQDDKAKTAFISPLGLMQFTVMPFGLSGAPATFQRLMDNILAGLEHIAGVYLDDIIVYGDTWEQHIQNVQTVFERLQKADLTLKLKKCNFGVEDCVYLGHRVGKGGVRPEQTKIEAISKMPRPTTKKEVRSFLGMVSYYRRFIQHFATKAEPLTALTKKGKPEKVIWTDQEQKSFQTLQADLSDSVMSEHFNFRLMPLMLVSELY